MLSFFVALAGLTVFSGARLNKRARDAEFRSRELDYDEFMKKHHSPQKENEVYRKYRDGDRLFKGTMLKEIDEEMKFIFEKDDYIEDLLGNYFAFGQKNKPDQISLRNSCMPFLGIMLSKTGNVHLLTWEKAPPKRQCKYWIRALMAIENNLNKNGVNVHYVLPDSEDICGRDAELSFGFHRNSRNPSIEEWLRRYGWWLYEDDE